MNEFEFNRLLDLYRRDRLAPQERKMVEDWFNQVDRAAEIPLDEADKNRLKNNILNRITYSAGTSLAEEESSVNLSRWTWLKIAASISIVFLIGFITWRFAGSSDEFKTYASDGSITKITLPDGSLVWLKGESSLQAPIAFDSKTRNVVLQGEALFEVAKDPQHPFVIQCGQVTTTVLGTSFNLRSFQNSIELTVLTGKVSLTSDHDETGVIVLPNEKVVYDAQKAVVSTQKIAVAEKTLTTDGTEYEMSFNDVSLDQVFSRIEKKFDVKILLNNDGLRSCKIRADFSDQSLENTLNMISQALDFRYTIEGNEVRLTGEACN